MWFISPTNWTNIEDNILSFPIFFHLMLSFQNFIMIFLVNFDHTFLSTFGHFFVYIYFFLHNLHNFLSTFNNFFWSTFVNWWSWAWINGSRKCFDNRIMELTSHFGHGLFNKNEHHHIKDKHCANLFKLFVWSQLHLP